MIARRPQLRFRRREWMSDRNDRSFWWCFDGIGLCCQIRTRIVGKVLLGGDRDYEDEVSSGGYTFVGPFWFTAFFHIFLESRLYIPLGLTHPHFSSASKRLSEKLQRANCDICGLELGECAHSEAEFSGVPCCCRVSWC